MRERLGLRRLSTSAPIVAGPIAAFPAEVPAEAGDYLEQLIRIIMDATGYERNEIEPQMDIRTDLAIRSSRLPIIMDAAERRFDIKVKLEDFIGLRTIQELADRIALVKARDGGHPPDRGVVAEALPPEPGPESSLQPAMEEAYLLKLKSSSDLFSRKYL